MSYKGKKICIADMRHPEPASGYASQSSFLPCQGMNIIPQQRCVCVFSFSDSPTAVESFLSTLTQIMRCILEAKLHGRFLTNPLATTSTLLCQSLTSTDTTRDRREPNVGTEHGRGVGM